MAQFKVFIRQVSHQPIQRGIDAKPPPELAKTWNTTAAYQVSPFVISALVLHTTFSCPGPKCDTVTRGPRAQIWPQFAACESDRNG
jgi:hypothetical protein